MLETTGEVTLDAGEAVLLPADPPVAEAPTRPESDPAGGPDEVVARRRVSGRSAHAQAGVETHSVTGRLEDAATGEPVEVFQAWLVPIDRGDPLQAIQSMPRLPTHDRKGRFRFDSRVAGYYHLVFRSPEYHDLVLDSVQIPRAEPILARLRRAGLVHGRVRDREGTPIEGIEVALLVIDVDPGHSVPPRRRSTTDRTGTFRFARIPPGVYRLHARIPGPVQQSHEPFRLTENAQVERSFSLDRLGTIEVFVTGPAGDAFPGALVHLLGDDGTRRQERADQHGQARFRFVPRGNHRIWTWIHGHEPAEEPVHVGPGEQHRIVRIQLQPSQPPPGD